MNGRMYNLSFDGAAATVAVDFFELAPADDKTIIIHAIHIGQSTELADAAEEQLRVTVQRGHTTTGTGGTATTPRPLNPSDAAAGAACDVMNTTQASAGTSVVLHADTFNVRAGWLWIPTPECRPISTQAAGFLVVRLMAAPGDSVTFTGSIFFEELG